MPAVLPPAKVLVTGATGFVAVNVVQALLDHGFSVRGTVRSESKGEFIKINFKDHGDKFEYVVVPDMQVAGAFDEAVKGVDAVEHVASPVTFPDGDPELVIGPAVNGTLSVLESARKYGPSIKRIVITSSIAAVGQPAPGQTAPVTEDAWNDKAVEAVKSQGASAHNGYKYSASKVLAERAAWDFVEKHKDEVGFDITTFCPPQIFGPSIQETASNGTLLNAVNPPKEGDALVARVGGWIDARDVAKIHVLALLEPAAGGERFITTAGGFTIQDIYDGLNEEPKIAGAPVGIPGATKGKKWDINFSTEKLQRILKKDASELFRPLAETAKDTVENARRRGFWDFGK